MPATNPWQQPALVQLWNSKADDAKGDHMHAGRAGRLARHQRPGHGGQGPQGEPFCVGSRHANCHEGRKSWRTPLGCFSGPEMGPLSCNASMQDLINPTHQAAVQCMMFSRARDGPPVLQCQHAGSDKPNTSGGCAVYERCGPSRKDRGARTPCTSPWLSVLRSSWCCTSGAGSASSSTRSGTCSCARRSSRCPCAAAVRARPLC